MHGHSGPCFPKSLPGQTVWRPPAASGVSGATPYSTTLQAWAGPRAAPRGGLRGNEVRINLPLRSALAALRSKPLGTPRLMPPDIPSFPSATPSFALALGHPSARKRLFQPQNCRVSSPAVPAVLPLDRWAWGEGEDGGGEHFRGNGLVQVREPRLARLAGPRAGPAQTSPFCADFAV